MPASPVDLNAHSPKLMKLLADPNVKTIVIEYRDRLMRFALSTSKQLWRPSRRRLVVLDPDEIKDDLAQDMIEVLTSFCTRLYGRRSAHNRPGKRWRLSNDKVKRGHRYELDPYCEQHVLLAKYAGGARFAYNWGLARRIET